MFTGNDMADWLSEPRLFWPVAVVWLAALLVLLVYASHRLRLVCLWRRTWGESSSSQSNGSERDLPVVTVQVPLFNEQHVAERVIDAVCTLDWPSDRLQIQVLDDSTEPASRRVVERRVEHWLDRGVDITLRHRERRVGFKAGALGEGIRFARGRFVAIFDADFVPPRDFLRRVMSEFDDERVGLVQTRWGHLNRDTKWLTRCQAICLDAHFAIEHAARHGAGLWMHFNGTAGVWRRSAIEDHVGGWQGDTLTEDTDLSYRSQLARWRFVYRNDVVCPAELPATLRALRGQQHRWSKGLIQTAIKLMPTLLRSDAPLRNKVEAWFHLTSPLTHLASCTAAVLTPIVLIAQLGDVSVTSRVVGLIGVGCAAAAMAASIAYLIAGQRAVGRAGIGVWRRVPALCAMGLLLAGSSARGVVEALLGQRSPFVRTPKRGCHTLARQSVS